MKSKQPMTNIMYFLLFLDLHFLGAKKIANAEESSYNTIDLDSLQHVTLQGGTA